ncbi:MAG: DUF4384 domain-containing protein, partial [Nitrospirota bacterium]|nr:DUF4384 domain-containing protein [Nitrospirota bacterium]
RTARLNIVRAHGPEDVELQGGTALVLTRGTELVRAPGISNRAPLRLRINKVHDLLTSQAAVVQGAWKDLRPGDEFEIVHRGNSHDSLFRLWLPPMIEDAAGAWRLAADLRMAVGSIATWVEDPTVTAPTHLIYWNGEEWILSPPSRRAVALGLHPTAAQIVATLEAASLQPRLFMNLPPSRALHEWLTGPGFAAEADVHITSDADEADYVLIGRAAARHSEYAWALRAFSNNHTSARTSPMPLPVRTAWGSEAKNHEACERGGLRDCGARLAKLHHWLTVKGTDEDRRFPYRLGFENLAGRTPVTTDTLTAGAYRLLLTSDQESIRHLQDTWGIQARYVYVFVIDQQGRSSLLFPNDASRDKENVLPTVAQLKQPAPALARIPLGDSGTMAVHEPYGTDTYILLTSVRPIPHIKELVESEQVVGEQDPLRGRGDWSIDRQFLRSMPGLDH